jgi:membrane protein required for colicin V production
LSKVDLTLALIIMVGAYGGFKEGFLNELLAFLGIVLGVLGGFKLMGWMMVLMEQKFNVDVKTLPYIAFAAVFFIIVFLVNLIARLVRSRTDKTVLGGIDQAAGSILGFFKTAFMMSVMLWIFHSMKFYFPEHWTEDSWILPMIAELAPDTTHKLADFVPIFKGVF